MPRQIVAPTWAESSIWQFQEPGDENMATPQFQHLFTPFTVGSVTVRNRIVVPGHATLFMPADGLPTERMLHYWVAKARGGVGLIMTHVHNVMPHHTGAPPVALQTDAIVPAYRKVVDALHDEGVKFFLQLNHVGGEGNSRMFGGVVLAPSAVRSTRANFLPTAQETPHEMEIKDIDEVVEAFRQAASKAREAGFDGVEIQGEVSFMLAQFMSPARNHRQDSYGGSLDNRLRFAREVIAAVRGGIGSDRVVGMRISGDEYFEGGLTLDDTILIVPRLEATGQLDFIHVGAGPGAASHIPPSYRKAGSFVYLTEAIRKVTDLALICSQRVNDPLIAESVLASGAADLVSMNRAIMTDPEMPTKAREGRLEEIRHCIACNECIARGRIGMPIACTMNAELGREQQMAIEKTDTPRHVLVVGGGPAGLEAARVASLRGHRVTLYEKGDTLGGQPLIASQAPGREELDEVRRYYTYQMGLQEVDVHLNTEATSETIEQEAPDAVVIATGSRAILSELTDDDDQDLVIQVFFVDILDQRRQRLVHVGQPNFHVLREVSRSHGVTGMVVPVREFLAGFGSVEVDIDDGGPGLGQASGQQAGLAPQITAVAVPQRVGFLSHVEGPRRFGAGEHLEGQVAKLVGAGQVAAEILGTVDPVELIDQQLAVTESLAVLACGDAGVRGSEPLGVGITNLERPVMQAQVGRSCHVRLLRDRHVGWHHVGARAQRLAGHRTEVRVGALGLRRRIGHQGGLAGQHGDSAIGVTAHLVMQRTHDRELVGDPGL